MAGCRNTIIASFGVAYQPAQAAGGVQGNLSAAVPDAATQAPLADVHITAQSPSGRFASSTDSSGRFTQLGLPADTYTVSFAKSGYDTISLLGVAVFGDETDSAGTIRMSKSLRTIVRVNARSKRCIPAGADAGRDDYQRPAHHAGARVRRYSDCR